MELQKQITGFMFYKLKDDGRVIERIGIHPSHQHEGIGEQFIWKMAHQLSGEQRKRISMVVGERNLAGQLFGSSLGFRAEEILPRHFEETGEDGYLMKYVMTRNPEIKPDYFLQRIPFTPEVQSIPSIYAM